MRGLTATYKNDLTKLYGKNFIRASFIVIAIILILGAIVTKLASAFSVINLDLENYSKSVLAPLAKFILPIPLFSQVSTLFSKEYDNGSIKFALTRPASRLQVFAGKVLALLTSAAIMLGIVLVLSTLVQVIFGYGFSLNGFMVSTLYYALTVLPMMCFIMLAVFVAQYVKSPGAVVSISVLVILAMFGISKVFSPAAPFFFTTYITWGKNFLTSFANIYWDTVIRIFLLLVSYIALFGTIAYAKFYSRDF